MGKSMRWRSEANKKCGIYEGNTDRIKDKRC